LPIGKIQLNFFNLVIETFTFLFQKIYVFFQNVTSVLKFFIKYNYLRFEYCFFISCSSFWILKFWNADLTGKWLQNCPSLPSPGFKVCRTETWPATILPTVRSFSSTFYAQCLFDRCLDLKFFSPVSKVTLLDFSWQNLQKLLGFAPSRAMNKQGQFGAGLFTPPQRWTIFFLVLFFWSSENIWWSLEYLYHNRVVSPTLPFVFLEYFYPRIIFVVFLFCP